MKHNRYLPLLDFVDFRSPSLVSIENIQLPCTCTKPDLRYPVDSIYAEQFSFFVSVLPCWPSGEGSHLERLPRWPSG